MRVTHLVTTLGLVARVQAAQIPLSYGHWFSGNGGDVVEGAPKDATDPGEENSYKLKWPVRKVAIIGAGPGGLLAYRELSQAGFDTHLYERDDVPGGNWHYTDETPLDAPIPNIEVAVGDYVPSLPPKGVEFPYVEVYEDSRDELGYEERRREHRGPKALWKTLTSNVPAPVQQFTEWPWPIGTPWELPHQLLQSYIRSFASWHGINSNDENPNAHYNTRVELVEKHHDSNGAEAGWRVVVKELVRIAPTKSKATWREEIFDAVIVSTGRWNAPNIPNSIAGLKPWSEKFPGRILHSRQYRFPEVFKNETVLIVGASSSGGEISRDINRYAKQVYQSIRPNKFSQRDFKLLLSRLPPNTTVIGEIKEVRATGSTFQDGEIVLINGTVVTGIDRVIFATGYHYSFPFLPAYHNSSIGPKEEAPRRSGVIQPIVTDGTHMRSLHLDLFYIPDPTLAFINMNIGMQTLTYGEYLSVALAKVWAGKAHLPMVDELWSIYDQKVKDRGGYGSHYLFLGSAGTKAAIRYFVGWLNDAAYKYGGRQLDRLPIETDIVEGIWTKARYSTNSYNAVSVDGSLNNTIRALDLDQDLIGQSELSEWNKGDSWFEFDW
ncbi:FAD/NAD(P)-binding domain-containing protein [Pluteus cervinus]|uniref:FAD/NAD(P)-binding domain-containing protein n=1 Tax=Pluteus cervinus TaxID=181527 RepID=A0ACD3AZZ1_9AGAR|nr:FAD/NAD(P)-binding domain-containing protein [Pluteus cervinus]